MRTADEARPRVAVCLAGAFRSFNVTWPAIRRNVVEPANAAVFVVTANHENPTAGARWAGQRNAARASARVPGLSGRGKADEGVGVDLDEGRNESSDRTAHGAPKIPFKVYHAPPFDPPGPALPCSNPGVR